MKALDGCAECKRLADSYESATMAWFRVEGSLRIAEYAHDEKSSRKLALELDLIGERRRALRAAMDRHQADHQAPAATMKAGC